MRGYGTWLMVVAIELWSRSAHACGTSASALPIRTITSIDVGAEPVLLNGVIELEIKTYPGNYDSESSPQLMVEVTKAEDGAVIAGELGFGDAHTYWHPSALLEPYTEYTILVVTDTTPRPDLDGEISMTASFTTGKSVAPALALEGSLETSLHIDRVGVTQCEILNDCGARRCDEVGTRNALFVDLKFPAVSGGFEGPGYSSVLLLDENTPDTFHGPGETQNGGGIVHYVAVRSDQRGKLSIELFDQGHPYAPCFALNVWDVAGNWISPKPLCLPELDVAEYIAERLPIEPVNNDGGTAASVLSQDAGRDDAGSEAEGPSPQRASDDERAEVSLGNPASSGCRIRASRPRAHDRELVGLVALAMCAALRARRRLSRRAARWRAQA